MAETIHIDDTRSHYALKATLRNGSVLLEGDHDGSAKLSVGMEQLGALAPFMASTPEGRAKMYKALGTAEPHEHSRLKQEAAALREQVRQGQLRIVDLQEQLEAAKIGNSIASNTDKIASSLAPYAMHKPAKWATGYDNVGQIDVYRPAEPKPDTTRDAPMQPASAELVRKVVDEALAKAGLPYHAAKVSNVRTTDEGWVHRCVSLWHKTAVGYGSLVRVDVSDMNGVRDGANECVAIARGYVRREHNDAKKTDAELTFGMLGVPR